MNAKLILLNKIFNNRKKNFYIVEKTNKMKLENNRTIVIFLNIYSKLKRRICYTFSVN